MKKKWEKPVMTVVAKSTEEENVLDSCKVGVTVPSGGGPNNNTCGWYQGPNGVVGPCMNEQWT